MVAECFSEVICRDSVRMQGFLIYAPGKCNTYLDSGDTYYQDL
jgi:hypothetical protein